MQVQHFVRLSTSQEPVAIPKLSARQLSERICFAGFKVQGLTNIAYSCSPRTGKSSQWMEIEIVHSLGNSIQRDLTGLLARCAIIIFQPPSTGITDRQTKP